MKTKRYHTNLKSNNVKIERDNEIRQTCNIHINI